MYMFTDSPIGTPKNKLVIYWEETVNGSVLWLLYDSDTDEHEAYVQFVKAVRQAVSDHVLPAKLADYWYDWEDIVPTGQLVDPFEQLPKQYTVIFTPNSEDAIVCSLCWKSTFEPGFFA